MFLCGIICQERCSHSPWLYKVGHCEKGAQKYANGSNHDIRNAERRVLATHNSPSTDKDGLGAVVDVDRKVLTRDVVSRSSTR